VIPKSKNLYLGECIFPFEKPIVGDEYNLFAYDFPIETIYVNGCTLNDVKLGQETLNSLKFISFDKGENSSYTRGIQYFKDNHIEVRYHSEEEFKGLIKEKFK
jgi:hypothetical protein